MTAPHQASSLMVNTCCRRVSGEVVVISKINWKNPRATRATCVYIQLEPPGQHNRDDAVSMPAMSRASRCKSALPSLIISSQRKKINRRHAVKPTRNKERSEVKMGIAEKGDGRRVASRSSCPQDDGMAVRYRSRHHGWRMRFRPGSTCGGPPSPEWFLGKRDSVHP